MEELKQMILELTTKFTDLQITSSEQRNELKNLTKTIDDLKQTSIKQHNELKMEFLQFKTNITTQVKGVEDAMRVMKTNQDEIKADVATITHSQEFISNEFDQMKKQNNLMDNTSQELIKQNEILNQKLQDAENQISFQYNCLDNLAQYGRRDQLEVNGFPQYENENTREIIVSLIKKLDMENIDASHVDVTHRLSTKQNSPIIIKFTSRTARNIFFDARKVLKNKTIGDFGFEINPNSKNKIFINESLTPDKKMLFKDVRAECTRKGFKYTWSRNGMIFAKKDEKSTAIKISTGHDIPKIK